MGENQRWRRTSALGFVPVVIIWVSFTFLCYERLIVFDGSTLGGAMLLGFVLTCSVLSLLRLLKKMYDQAYLTLKGEDD